MDGVKTRNDDFHTDIRRSHHRRYFIWIILLIILLSLTFLFSAGFFLYPAAAVSLLLFFSFGLASANLVGIKIVRTLSASQIKWGEAIEAKLKVTNQKSLAAFWIFWEDHIDKALDVEGPTCHYKTLAPSKSHEIPFRIHSTRRGFFRIGPAVVESSGPFGLVQRFLVGQHVDFLTVLPRIVPIEKGLLQGQLPVHLVPRRRSIFKDPSRFLGVRDYLPGDSLRQIHWKATARSRNIKVNLFEPAVLTGALLAIDMHHSSYQENGKEKGKIDSLLEFTITAAASLGEYVLAGDQRVGMLSNGGDAAEQYSKDWKGGIFRRYEQVVENTQDTFDPHTIQPVELPPGKGQGQLEQLHAALARLVFSGDFSLPELLQTELPRLPRSLVIVVFTPVINQALDTVLGSLQKSGIETAVVWIRDPNEQFMQKADISHNIPVYQVRNDEDLIRLGGQGL